MFFRAPEVDTRMWPEEWINGQALPSHVHSFWNRLVESALTAAARRIANSVRLSDGSRVVGRLGRPVIPQVNEYVHRQAWEVLRQKSGLTTILRLPIGPLEGHP